MSLVDKINGTLEHYQNCWLWHRVASPRGIEAIEMWTLEGEQNGIPFLYLSRFTKTTEAGSSGFILNGYKDRKKGFSARVHKTKFHWPDFDVGVDKEKHPEEYKMLEDFWNKMTNG